MKGGGGGSKNLKKLMTSFMNGPLLKQIEFSGSSLLNNFWRNYSKLVDIIENYLTDGKVNR